jgi:hypothetical protein
LKLRSFAFALAAFAITACSNNPGISPAPSGPNPSSVLVTVTVGGTPTANITVTLSTQLNGALPVSGTILATGVTDGNGHVTFSAVPAIGTLCLSAVQSAPGFAAAVGACHSQPIPATATLKFTAT